MIGGEWRWTGGIGLGTDSDGLSAILIRVG